MLIRALRISVAAAISAVAIAWLLVSCMEPPPSTDAGADPSISDCCNWYILPLLYDRPQACLCQHTNEGEQRWLTCLGGLVEYTCDRRSK